MLVALGLPESNRMIFKCTPAYKQKIPPYYFDTWPDLKPFKAWRCSN